eukprot:scaffold34129_cov112-Isochrysis_galbana.AAC.2
MKPPTTNGLTTSRLPRRFSRTHVPPLKLARNPANDRPERSEETSMNRPAPPLTPSSNARVDAMMPPSAPPNITPSTAELTVRARHERRARGSSGIAWQAAPRAVGRR